jgi:2-dehydropantoate 2-reductase
VTICDTDSEVIANILQNGIVLSSMDGGKNNYPAKAVQSASESEKKADLVIIFTKAGSTRAAAETARSVLAPDGLVVTLQNGIGHLEIIGSVIEKNRIITGVTAQAANVLEPGHAQHAGAGMTSLGSVHAAAGKVEIVCQVFNDAGIESVTSDNVDGLIWGKLLVNVGINALTAILKVPNGSLAETRETVTLMEQVVSEAAAVAGTLGIQLPYDDPMEEVLNVCRITASNRASMLQDVLKNAPTEIDAINGAVATRAGKLGIPAPANTFITQIIKAIEATSEKRISA